MRFVKILNISVLFFFLSVWVLLYVEREEYQGDGMYHPLDICTDSTYFSKKNPFIFSINNKVIGFTSKKGTKNSIITGIWELDINKKCAKTSPLPHRFYFDSLVSALKLSDSSILLVGLYNDSIAKIIKYDSIIKPFFEFETPSHIRGVSYMKNHLEVVFSRKKKSVGIIASMSDSNLTFRNYELPVFFNRICEIVAAKPDKNKWSFLLMTEFHHVNEKWVSMGNCNKTNFLIFDERAVFPDFPGILNKSKEQILSQFDYAESGLLPKINGKKNNIILIKDKLIENKINIPSSMLSYNINFTDSNNLITVFDFGNIVQEKGYVSYFPYYSLIRDSIPFKKENNRLIFYRPDNADASQIFLSENEFPIGFFKIKKDSSVLITNKLNYALLNKNGKLIDQTNFFKLVNKTISKHYPSKIMLLDFEFPELKAFVLFVLLYGLIPIWILSLIITWLIIAIKPKSIHVVQVELRFALRLLPGSIIYLIIFAANICVLVKIFSFFAI